MAGWLHGVFVGDWLFVFPLCGFSLSLFCNYARHVMRLADDVATFGSRDFRYMTASHPHN